QPEIVMRCDGEVTQCGGSRSQFERLRNFSGNMVIRCRQPVSLSEIFHKVEVRVFIHPFPNRNQDRVESAANEKCQPDEQKQDKCTPRHKCEWGILCGNCYLADVISSSILARKFLSFRYPSTTQNQTAILGLKSNI